MDDGSTDKTYEEAQVLLEQDSRIKYVRHLHNQGYGEALRTGIKNSQYEHIFFTDGDAQFDISDLKLLLPYQSQDLVIGYRLKRADPMRRLFIAATYHLLLKLCFGLQVKDVDCAFKLFSKKATAQIVPSSKGAFFSAEYLLRAKRQGFSISEVGVPHYPRQIGVSKGAGIKVIFQTIIDLVKLKWELMHQEKL